MKEISVTKEFKFCYGHCLPGHGGKCKNQHGHNCRVLLTFGLPMDMLSSKTHELLFRENEYEFYYPGMVVDFGLIKKKIKPLVETLDHHYLNELPWFIAKLPIKKRFVPKGANPDICFETFQGPTAEMISYYFWNHIKVMDSILSDLLLKVVVFESDGGCASLEKQDQRGENFA